MYRFFFFNLKFVRFSLDIWGQDELDPQVSKSSLKYLNLQQKNFSVDWVSKSGKIKLSLLCKHNAEL